MALSYGFKKAVKQRKRRSRRLEVIFFVSLAVSGILTSTKPFQWGLLNLYLYPILKIYTSGQASWDWRRRVIPVSTLDDRAMLEYSKRFDDLDGEGQEAIFKKYRGGTWLLNYYPDEREHELRTLASLRAYEVMRYLLPMLALLCAGMWHWIGGVNVLVLLFWVVIVVLALPQMILLWTEPDDLQEMGIVEPLMRRDGES